MAPSRAAAERRKAEGDLLLTLRNIGCAISRAGQLAEQPRLRQRAAASPTPVGHAVESTRAKPKSTWKSTVAYTSV